MKTYHHPTLSNFYENSILRFIVPNVMTLNNELYVGQRLFLIQGTKMKIVEVMKVSETDDMMHLRVKNLHDQEIIELSCSLDYDSPDYSITWMIISIPYITELVIERMKQRFHK